MMPTVPDYIRFSLLVSMAVLAGLVLVLNKQLYPRLRLATLGGVVLLFLFQHLLAVRSGISDDVRRGGPVACLARVAAAALARGAGRSRAGAAAGGVPAAASHASE
ncbi:MAG: hypothetical protein WKG07_20055 [Hymenobacter sp.]